MEDFKYLTSDEMHIKLLEILTSENPSDEKPSITWENLKNLIDYLDDDFLYSLCLYRFFFIGYIKGTSADKIKFTDKIRKELMEKMLKRYPKLSLPPVFLKPKFKELLSAIYTKFKQIYDSIIASQINELDKLYIFSWIFFPCIFDVIAPHMENNKKIEASDKEEEEEKSLKKEITRIIKTRFCNDLPNIYDKESIGNFFSGLYTQNDSQKNDSQKNDSFGYADTNDSEQFSQFPIIGQAIPLQCITGNSTSKFDLKKIIKGNPDKIGEDDFEKIIIKDDFFKIIIDGDLSKIIELDNSISKYDLCQIDNISPFILRSKLFQGIIKFLFSDGQREKFYFYGNLFEFAAQLTLHFFNFGYVEENLEFISDDDPVLNGLSLIIRERVKEKLEFHNEEGNLDILSDYFVDGLVNELVEEGKKINEYENRNADDNKNKNKNDESLIFKIKYSVMIGYKFSAESVFKESISKKKFFISRHDKKNSLTKIIILMLKKFSQNMDDDDDKNGNIDDNKNENDDNKNENDDNKNENENDDKNENDDNKNENDDNKNENDDNKNGNDDNKNENDDNKNENENDDKNGNIENEIINLINIKGFYYHFFILRTLDFFDDEKNKMMLSSFYKILLYLDEFYMQIFDIHLFNCSIIANAVKNFCKDFSIKYIDINTGM